VALPTLVVGIGVGVGLAIAGRADMIVGQSAMVLGAIYVGLTTVAPLKEFSLVGVMLIVGGAVAMFVLEDYPFYKLAVIWGLPFVLFDGIRLRFVPRGEGGS
jgi:hypothetical protein